MIELDNLIERFEQLVQQYGIVAIQPQEFLRRDLEAGHAESQEETVVELLRVWMEYRWRAGLPTTAAQAMAEFPDRSFSSTAGQLLAFEEQRQLKEQRSNSLRLELRSVADLPSEGEAWGDFQLLEVIGQGAFARVFLARQQTLAGRLVALKLTFLPSEEGQLLASLHHTSIVPVYSLHCIDEVYGICMPFLGNTTFLDMLKPHASAGQGSTKRTPRALLQTVWDRQRLLRHIDPPSASMGNGDSVPGSEPPQLAPSGPIRNGTRPITPGSTTPASLQHGSLARSVCWMGMQLAEGLWHAHCRGVLHSDIKPANILVGSDGQPRLIDFNISQGNTISIDPDRLGGTYPYMAPEHRQAMERAGSIDARADIYSLGMVLIELLVGQLPRAAWAPLGDSLKIVRQARELLTAERITPALQAIVLKAIASEAIDRYQSANHLAEDLRAQYEDRPLIHQREPSGLERAGKWMRRHPQITSNTSLGALALMLLLVAGVTIVSLRQSLERSQMSRARMLLSHSLPASIALASSSAVDPRQIRAAVDSANQSLAHLDGAKGGIESDADFWNPSSSATPGLAEELHLWLAITQPWTREMLTRAGAPEDQVAALLDRRERLMRSSPDSGQHVGILEELRQIRHSLKAGAIQEAIDALKSKDLAASSNYAAWWMLGDAWLAAGQALPAQQAYTACIALRPDIAVAFFNRASAQLLIGSYQEAVDDYEHVLRLQPDWPWVRFNQAVSLSRMGRSQEALAALQQVQQSGLSSVSVHRLASQLHQQLGEEDKAQQQRDLALKVIPSCSQDWIDRGLLNLRRDPKASAEDFQQALRLDPHSLDAHQKLAHVYAEYLQDPERALSHLDVLVAKEAGALTHRAGRAVLSARLGKWQSMREDLTVLESSLCDEPMVQYQIASAYAIAAPAMLPDLALRDSSWSCEALTEKALVWIQRALVRSPKLHGLMKRDEDLRSLHSNEWFSRQLAAAEILSQLVPQGEAVP